MDLWPAFEVGRGGKGFDLPPRDVGNFYTRRWRCFAGKKRAALPGMCAEEAVAAMDRATGPADGGLGRRAIGASAVMLGEGARIQSVARRAAGTLVRHLAGQRLFAVAGGGVRPRGRAHPAPGCAPQRADRRVVPAGRAVRYLRVIDYKTRAGRWTMAEITGEAASCSDPLLAAARGPGRVPGGRLFFFAGWSSRCPSPLPRSGAVALCRKGGKAGRAGAGRSRVIEAMSPTASGGCWA
jgi:hypothetical protein